MDEPTIFIIDDDEACRDVACELINSVGLVATAFSSAIEFLAAFDATWKGCLVLDLHMPGMNGRALQKRLQDMGVDLPIVFISGNVDVPTAFHAIKNGAVDFPEKPYSQQQFLDAIGQALRRDRA
ncbi:response regulator [Variovorax sp. J22R133]|uniref:response regulator transcription factor n=1 Tax=Variovorax brevis TaxID=3053503 RepID=UPI002578896D|nr:response regulator [Variovorax sp. J22R133]MDM0117759.1 response regulator [Variovorax sp. J22R133]